MHVQYSEFSLIYCNSFSKIDEIGRLTGYSLLLVHNIGTGNCGGLKGLVDKAVVD